MHSDLVELGWTEDHWNRVNAVVTEEAQKARVAAQVLPVVGPEHPSTVAIPPLTLHPQRNPFPYPPGAQLNVPPAARGIPGVADQPLGRLWVDSSPTLYITTISVNVPLRGHDVADPELKAALTMFRRAANYVARLEDALVFNGRTGGQVGPVAINGVAGVPAVFGVSGDGGAQAGIFDPNGPITGAVVQVIPPPAGGPPASAINRPPLLNYTGGDELFRAVVNAIGQLDANGQLAPYGCVLGQDLFDIACTPNPNFVIPRDRILPFLQGPLLRSSGLLQRYLGAVIALSGNPIELVVASDINVQFLQTTLEPRYVFRVRERVALRIKEWGAIAILTP